MATHTLIMPEIRPAAGLPTVDHVIPRFTQADPIPGLASHPRRATDATEQARAITRSWPTSTPSWPREARA